MKFSGGGLAYRLIDFIYPLGSVIASVNSAFDPNVAYKHQTWVRFAEGKTLVGVDSSDTDFSTAENTGGEKVHTLTESEMPEHRHCVVAYSSSGNDYSGSGAVVSFSYNASMRGWAGFSAPMGKNMAHNNMQPYVTVYYWKRTA